MSNPARILVVEDNPEDFLILKTLMAKTGAGDYVLSNAASLEAGLDELSNRRFDVYLVDYRLGPDSGFDFLRAAASMDDPPPVILLTGQGDPEVDREAMRLGAADYVNKSQLDTWLLERVIRYSLERKRAAEQLSREKEYYRALIENALEGVMVANRDGNISYLSPSVERILGYPGGDKNWVNLLDYVFPEDAIGVREFLGRLSENPALSTTTEFQVRHRDGTWRTLEVTGKTRVLPADAYPSLVLNYRDVTDRRKAERALARLASIVDTSSDAIYSVTREGIILSWNPGAERIYGFSAREAGGRDLSLIVPSEGPEGLPRILEILRRGDTAANLTAAHRTKDGRVVVVSMTLTPLKDPSGETTRASIIARDISEQKKTEEVLAKQEEQMMLSQKMDAIGRLAGGVAHDFNNLLSVITGNADFLKEGMAEGDPGREEIGEIQKAVKQGSDLTRQLLIFGKRQEAQPQAVWLDNVCVEMNKMFRRLIDASVELRILPGGGLKPIYADLGQIQQVILNLVLNARDAMPNGGVLILETVLEERVEDSGEGIPAGTYVRLSVTDTGTGIEPEIQKRIFEPFFTTKGGKGTGLGLATVYSIVSRWNGHIRLTSIVGRGSTFTLYFRAMEALPHETPKEGLASGMEGGKETLLVAEDEDAVRKILVRQLKKLGYKVLEGENGAAALQAAEKHAGEIDLLLTDTIMPKMNGRELVAELIKVRPILRVIFVSGYPEEILTEAMDKGENLHWVQKPYAMDDLARKIRRVLDEP